MSDLFVSNEEYDDLIEQLILKVADSGYEFDSLLCLARGGLRVGDIFSRVYDKPLAILATSSYRENAGRVKNDLDIATFITKTGGEIAGRLLIVDDLVDSGVTAKNVIEHIRSQFDKVSEIRFAVLWQKSHSAINPDYYVKFCPDNPWIHQPFERYDALGIENLRKIRAKK